MQCGCLHERLPQDTRSPLRRIGDRGSPGRCPYDLGQNLRPCLGCLAGEEAHGPLVDGGDVTTLFFKHF